MSSTLSRPPSSGPAPSPQPPSPPWPGPTWREANDESLAVDDMLSWLSDRIVDLEHALVSRRARRRLRRQIGRSAQHYSYAGRGFYDRRVESLWIEWPDRPSAD